MPSFLAQCLGSTRVFLQSSTFPRCSGHCWVACPARRYSRLWVSMAPRLRPVLLPPAAWSCTSPTQDHPVQIVRNGGGQLEQGGIAFHCDTDVIDAGYLQVSPVHHQYSLCIHSCSVNIHLYVHAGRLSITAGQATECVAALAMLQLSSAIT